MRVEKEIEKTLIKIARKVRKEMHLPGLINQFTSIKVNTKDTCLSVYYNEKYVAAMDLWDSYKNYYSVKYIADQLKDKLFHYASNIELKRNENKDGVKKL